MSSAKINSISAEWPGHNTQGQGIIRIKYRFPGVANRGSQCQT
jgi:hypothetical protein